MKSGFWKSDWFLGLVVALLVFVAGGGPPAHEVGFLEV